MEQRLKDCDWAAGYFGRAKKTIYGWARAGKIPSVPVGRRIYFDAQALDAFVQAGGKTLEQLAAERRRSGAS